MNTNYPLLPLPPPTGFIRFLLRSPLELHRLGLGWLVSFAPILILTTRGRRSGQPRHVALEYRRHGSKLYIISALGQRAQWVQNLQAAPCATIKLGNRAYRVQAAQVEDKSEAQRVLYLFLRSLPGLYDPVLRQMRTAEATTPRSLGRLPEIVGEFTILRLELQAGPPPLPPLAADHLWVIPAVLGAAVFSSAMLELLTRLRDNTGRQDGRSQ